MKHFYLLLITSVAALGGLLFGFDTAVISGTIPFLTKYFNLNDVELGWVVSCVLVGCMVGTLIAGRLSDRIGRKKTLIITSLLFALSAVGTAIATDINTFIFSRLVCGVAVGAASILSPLYIAEISPASIRGRLVSLNQLAIILGILVSFFTNYLLSGQGDESWRWMFGSAALPSVLFLVFLFMVPESPRWLVKKGKIGQAELIIQKIIGTNKAKEEVKLIHDAIAKEERAKLSDLLDKKYRLVLILGIMLAIFQQITGINVILYYAPLIFAKTGSDLNNSLLQTVAIGVVNLSFTVVAIWLVEKVGRKILLLTGSLSMAISLLLLSLCFYFGQSNSVFVIVLIFAYIASFAVSLGPVVWVVISEIFPTKIRGVAMSVATFLLWLACFIVSVTFPWLLNFSPESTFGLYALMGVATFLFVKQFLPETKGKSLERIEEELVGKVMRKAASVPELIP